MTTTQTTATPTPTPTPTFKSIMHILFARAHKKCMIDLEMGVGWGGLGGTQHDVLA
jgi:hypothetical protein